MSYQAYLDSRKLGIEDPPYYGLIAAAVLVADSEERAKLDHAWGRELKRRDFDLKAGEYLVNTFPEYTLDSYLYAAIVQSDTNNMYIFERYFPATLAERKARYNAPGGRLPGDPEIED